MCIYKHINKIKPGVVIFGWRPLTPGSWCKRKTQICVYRKCRYKLYKLNIWAFFLNIKAILHWLCLFFFFPVGTFFTTNLCHHQCYFCLYEHSKDLRALSSSPICDICSWYSVDVSLHCRDDRKNAYPWDC